MTDTPRQFTAEDYERAGRILEGHDFYLRDGTEGRGPSDCVSIKAMFQQAADMAREREQAQIDKRRAEDHALETYYKLHAAESLLAQVRALAEGNDYDHECRVKILELTPQGQDGSGEIKMAAIVGPHGQFDEQPRASVTAPPSVRQTLERIRDDKERLVRPYRYWQKDHLPPEVELWQQEADALRTAIQWECTLEELCACLEGTE